MDRTKEISYLRECKRLSNNKFFSLCIFGLRRVGKTRLILEFLDNEDIYFFVNKDKQGESLLKEYEDALKNRKVLGKLESLNGWDDFFNVLFERFRGLVAFDEFQNFAYVYKSVFGILQKNIDLNEDKKKILMLFSGSTVGLIKKIFLDEKEPLYGRLKRKMHLKPLPFPDIVDVCSELGIDNVEDVIRLYSVFGGFPKYYTAIEDEMMNGRSPEEIFEKFFFVENAVFEDEANAILSLEFGKRKGVYYDILAAIANGNTRISEIASSLRKKETALTRQVNELTNYFNIVGVKRQVCGKKTSMFIEHPLIDFWFRFFYKDMSLYKMRDRYLIDKIRDNMNGYIGKRFEKVCENILINAMPFRPTDIGNQWGKFKGEKGKNTYEIDIVAISDKEKKILFAECKWSDAVDAEKVYDDLLSKKRLVDWHKDSREEYFAVFARSFKKKTKHKNIYLFDLKDIKKLITR